MHYMIHYCLILLIWASNNLNPKEEKKMYSEFLKKHTYTLRNFSSEFSPSGKSDPEGPSWAVKRPGRRHRLTSDLAQDDKSLASGLSSVSCHLPPTPFPGYRSCVSPLSYVNYCGRCWVCLLTRKTWEGFMGASWTLAIDPLILGRALSSEDS